MTYLAEHREVRVTRRVSIGQDFIAPELSPVRTVDSEAVKGKKGWTDLDVKVPDLNGDHLPRGFEDRKLEAFNAPKVAIIRKAPTTNKVRKPRSSVRRWD